MNINVNHVEGTVELKDVIGIEYFGDAKRIRFHVQSDIQGNTVYSDFIEYQMENLLGFTTEKNFNF